MGWGRGLEWEGNLEHEGGALEGALGLKAQRTFPKRVWVD